MASGTMSARVIHMHDVEERWNFAINFVPKAGEIVVYDADSTHSYVRFKIGDGKTSVPKLPFAAEAAVIELFNVKNDRGIIDGGKITEYPTSST